MKDRNERAKALAKIEGGDSPLQLIGRLKFSAEQTNKIIINEQGKIVAEPTRGRATPQVCQTCHQTGKLQTSESSAQQNKNNMPIWKRYVKWNGFFGELDDKADSVNLKCRQEFQHNLNTPRYRHLEELKRLLDTDKDSVRLWSNNMLFSLWMARLASVRAFEGKTDQEIFSFMCREKLKDTVGSEIIEFHQREPSENYIMESAKGHQDLRKRYNDGRGSNTTLWETLFTLRPHLRKGIEMVFGANKKGYFHAKSNLLRFYMPDVEKIRFQNKENICLGLEQLVSNSSPPTQPNRSPPGAK